MIQFRKCVLQRVHKTNDSPAVAFSDKILETFAFKSREISYNSKSHPVVGELLQYLAGQFGFKIEKVMVQTFIMDDYRITAMVARICHNIQHFFRTGNRI